MEKLMRRLSDIPARYRPIPFWSWNDALEIPELLRQIRWMKENCIGGFFMHARGGLKTSYLSEKWMRSVEACCDEAARLGMNAWAYDENGWPSGFVGGKLLDDPKNRNQFLTHTIGAWDAQADVSYQITDKQLYRVDAPKEEGQYLNLYLHTSPSTVDVLNPRVVRQFLDETHARYKAHFGDAFAEKIVGFFTDEPQYYTLETPYTPMAEAYFREVYHQDIFDGLGLLFLEKQGYETFRYRYWLALQTLMLENFARQVYTWCDSNGVKLTGHYVEEGSVAEQMLACAGIMPFYEYEHIPGIDWLGAVTDCELSPRQVGSVARQLGKKQAITESFAGCGWNISPADLKRIAGFQYACGVNLLCHHLMPYSEHGQRKKDYPVHFNRINPWIDEHFREFNDFFGKLGYLLAEGEEPVNVAVLHPQRSAYLFYHRQTDCHPNNPIDQSLRKACRTLSGRGVAYHFLDEPLLEKHGFVSDGQIGCGQCAYTYLVLPKMLTMGRHTEKLLRQFVENGGKVLLTDGKPRYLEGEPFDYPYLESTCTLAEILQSQPLEMTNPDTELYCAYRILEGRPFLFLQNASATTSYTQTFRFRENVRSFVALDLITGETKHLSLTVTLEKNQGMVLFPSEVPLEVEQTTPETIPFRFRDAKVDFDTNFMTLDMVQYSKDGENYSQSLLCGELCNLLLQERYIGNIHLRYTFRVEEIPEKISLLSEKIDHRDVRINDHPIVYDRTLEEEPCVEVADITEYIHRGQNVYEVSLNWYQREETFYALFGEGVTESLKNCIVYESEIEPVYLAGKFGVYGEFEPFEDRYVLAENLYIGRIPEKISQPVTDGLPFFRGQMRITQTLQLPHTNVRLAPQGDFLTAKIWVNGDYAGEVCFENTLDISRFAQIGENRIEVAYTIGNRNLLGPLHSANPEILVTPFRFSQNDLPGSEQGRTLYKLRYFYANA